MALGRSWPQRSLQLSWRRPRSSSPSLCQAAWPAKRRRTSRGCHGRCQVRFVPPAMSCTQLPRRPQAPRPNDAPVRSATKRCDGRSSDADWRSRDLSPGHKRLATRPHACVRSFRLARGRRCRRTALTGRTGRRSRFARRTWRAWFGAHGTAGPPAIPNSPRRIGTRLRRFVRVQRSRKAGHPERGVSV